MIKLAVYEQIIARPSNTIENECTSIIKAKQQILQATLKANQKRYMNMVVMSPMKHLPQYYHVPAISISELSRFTSTEVKAFEDVTTIHLSLVQLTVNRAALEQEIRNIRSKERRQTEPVKWTDAVEDANEIQEIKSIIKECGDTMQEHESWIMSLRLNAWVATNAANRAAKSDVEMPRISTRSPSPVPAAIAATPLSAPTPATTACDIVTLEPITIASVQVAVADTPPEVKAAAKDIKARKASNVVATVPKNTTAITKVDKTLSSITL